MQTKKLTGKTMGMSLGIAIGILVSIGVTLIGSLILAWLITAGKINENAIGYGAMAVLFLSTFLGCAAAVVKTKRLRVQVCLITGGGYYLTLLAMTALFFDGRYQGMGVSAILVLLSSGLMALLGIRDKRSRKSKFKKHAFC